MTSAFRSSAFRTSFKRTISTLRPSSHTSKPYIPKHNFSTTSQLKMSAPKDSSAFLEAVANRRTYYALDKTSPIPDSKIKEIIETAVLNVPSSFNAQSARLVLLLGAEHDHLWNGIVLPTLLPFVKDNEESKKSTEARVGGFAAARGTILFFEDPEPIDALAKAFTLYADKFPQWSEHTSAMHQFVIWTALEAEGLGANIQHYNPIVDDQIKEKWNIPKDWSLKAQIVFGGKLSGPAGGATKEQKKPVIERFFSYGT
jgi:uncharacterized protein